MGITRTMISAYNAKANGMIGRGHQPIIAALIALTEGGKPWVRTLDHEQNEENGSATKKATRKKLTAPLPRTLKRTKMLIDASSTDGGKLASRKVTKFIFMAALISL